MALSPLKPLHPEIRNPASLQELAVQAVKNSGETARKFLPPSHTVRMQLEEAEYQALRKKYQKGHAKKIR